MDKNAALREAQRRWGETAAVQDNGKKFASTPEARKAARDALRSIPNTRETRRERDRLFSASFRYRFSVGHFALGMFFKIMGQGDTWEQAFEGAVNK
ncbi:MAG: hypothetical protein WAP47_08650 [Candidatus Rokuibacteriota bacterium]